MRNITFSALLILMVFPVVANATVFGGSNLGFGGYEEFSAMEPTPPYDRSEYSMNAYRSDVESYIQNAKEYTENADNDVKRIREAQEEALSKANRVVEEYNSTARGY
ncbi:hypothetical protein [Trabulsiella guamensis]|nr:hypothetical protein [Trabulsiella guamensis]